MIGDEQVRWIALFFLLGLMDEKTALHAAHKTVGHFKAVAGGEKSSEAQRRIALLRAMVRSFEVHRKSLPTKKVLATPSSIVNHFVGAGRLDLVAWAKFQKEASDHEVVAVILSKILAFTDHEIADALDVSLGTARYRIGNGIRQLGNFVELTNAVKV